MCKAAAKMPQNMIEDLADSCRNNRDSALLVLMQDAEEYWEVTCTTLKFPTEAMMSLSHFWTWDPRLMGTVETYYGWTF